MAPKEEALFEHEPQPGDNLTEREALAVSLAERIALDPHTVTDEFFDTLKGTAVTPSTVAEALTTHS